MSRTQPAFTFNSKRETTMQAILIDTEVNGMEHKEPIEVAWAEWSFDSTGPIQAKRFRPVNPIEAGAAVVHKILDCDLVDEDESQSARDFVPEAEYWIAHNIGFDASVMGETKVRRICTLALSQSLWPDLKSHKLGSLIYELCGMTPQTRELLNDAHAAGKDVQLLSIVLDAIVKQTGATDLAELYEASEEAMIPKVIRFGKHAGSKISELPRDYCQWLLRQDWLDEHMRKALTH